MTTERRRAPIRRRYWVMNHITECPLCGRGHTTRTRVYDKPKPAQSSLRYAVTAYACASHFA